VVHAARAARASERDGESAAELALALALVERPPLDLPGADGAGRPGRADRAALESVSGRLALAARRARSLAAALEDVQPAWAAEDASLDLLEPLPPACPASAAADRDAADGAGGGDAPRAPPLSTALDEADRELVDAVFRRHLPELGPRAGAPLTYRASQHAVAARVARSLGTGELLLVHAPTGTGKTLAYLVPALVFAARQELRLGVATFTRALQEQAAERELPRALAALAAAGLDPLPRTAVLKGRQNYLCWRALERAVPQPSLVDDGPASILAWTELALFALADPEGDLDRLSLAPRLPGFSSVARAAGLARELARLARETRSEPGCCAQKRDRRACAAEVARRRAERAHLVVTNHALALQKRDFLKHVVFDECEHLHDQAQSAFSHEVSLADGRDALSRLGRRGESPERLPLPRLERHVPPGSPARAAVESARAAQQESLEAIDGLEYRLHAFGAWREEALATRGERDAHSLFREYASGPLGAPLVEAQRALGDAFARLAVALAEIAESLESLPLRGAARVRRALDRARIEIDEWSQGVLAWLPVADGVARFSPEVFYDVARDGADLRLVARVLLPHEFLGRHVHPQLAGGVFVSATTWIRGGFESQSLYLGLARAASPAPDEERAGMPVATFKADEVFDYGRVLVAVPQDAPALRGDARALHLEYVRNFVAHLAERTRGRLLVLFTNAEDCARVGRGLERFFAERSIPFWYQRMPGVAKEELADLFRARTDSVLLGLDTFWFGADFPGETLEYLAIVRLPFGVPDAYHHAQCAAIGAGEQRGAIYMPKALAKFRQGFGRLMRRESDRGVVFLLDARVLEPKNRAFLRELPLAGGGEPDGARCITGTTDECLHAAFAHMAIGADVKRRGLDAPFWQRQMPFEARERTAEGDEGEPA
jgi:Rad3-related DNA helicase